MSSWISERAVSKSPLLHACRQAVVTDEAPGMINPPLLSGQTIPTPGHPALTLLGTSPPCLSARFGHSLVRDKPCEGQAWRGARGTRSTRNQEHEERETHGTRSMRRGSMRYRQLGRTGLSVSEIGYGAWGIGGSMWVGAEEHESARALHRAIELGMNFIDTARGYGESEGIVGKVVRDHRGDDLYVATKVPPKNGIWPAPSGVDPAETF